MNQFNWAEKGERYLNGRGAQINTPNRYHQFIYDEEVYSDEDSKVNTNITEVYPKTIVNEVKSPDIPLPYSMNPYQGCEHGCVYCYARNTHAYWGYSAGVEFEQKILVKRNAAKLLEEKLKNSKWEAAPIMLSGNTDCYQPIERELEITRGILEVFWKYRHPVGVITKNSLILRDLDLLEKLAAHNLVHVAISITTLNEELRRFLEPRTSSIVNRINAVKILAERNIPVTVMMAPIIPSLNDHEILPLAKKVSEAGASAINHSLVRLNGDVARIFEDWLHKNLPDRAEKVLGKIRDCHSGELGNSRFKERMRGKGQYAEMIVNQFKLARQLYFKNNTIPSYDLSLHYQIKQPQLKLF